MADEAKLLTQWHDRVLLVTFNRPAASNALDPEMLQAMSAAWKLAAGARCRALVITGAGRNFCAGADLAAAKLQPMGLREVFHPQYLALAALPKPVIAAINGAAAGGGLGIALAADIRIMAETARLVPGWVQIGIVPDLGASWFATRLMGYARAFDWFAGGEPMSSGQALSLGLANAVVPPDALLDHALARAQRLADQPGSAVVLTKQLLQRAAANGLADQLELETITQDTAFADPDRAQQVAARMARFAPK